MCRWLAYHGSPILIQELLFHAEHSLIDQSLNSKSKETPTNGDGFGLGWYGHLPEPGLFRSIRPAWNDFNLRDLAAHVESPLFLAHVRATSLATVQETNCHPFRYGKWLFVHNGEIEEFEKFRRDLYFAVAPRLFNNILGSTDSELMFYLALTFGLEDEPIAALERMAGLIEKMAGEHGIREAIWMTLGLTDGSDIFAVRYASGSDPPTLFETNDLEHLFQLNKRLRGRADRFRLVVSEPIGCASEHWRAISPGTAVTFRHGEVVTKPFKPQPPI